MRHVATVPITAEGRDKGKVFQLTEMPATQGERWAIRALMAVAKGGLEVPEDIQGMGMAGIAALGFQALAAMPFQDAEPLLEEMFACIEIVPDPQRPQVVRRLIEDDIEEVVTRLLLRKEVFDLHTGFFTRAKPSTSTSQKRQTVG